MFDFDAGKLLIIGTVALVVIGPKDLPRVLRQLGQAIGRLRRMAGEFQGQFMEAIKEADLQDLRTEVAKLKESATLDVNFDPVHDIKTHVTEAVSAPVVSSTVGTTSELAAFNLPAPSGIGSEPAVGSIGPEAPTETAPATGEPVAGDDAGEPGKASVRRKVVVTRRRATVRLDGPAGRSLATTRPRSLLPARRETPDR